MYFTPQRGGKGRGVDPEGGWTPPQTEELVTFSSFLAEAEKIEKLNQYYRGFIPHSDPSYPPLLYMTISAAEA
jgi:hypothetical protein